MVDLMMDNVEPDAVALAGSAHAADGYRVLWRPGQSVIDWRGRVRVYDVARNPSEDIDAAVGDVAVQADAESALAEAFGRLSPIGTWTDVSLDDETTDQLQALGYLR